MRFGIVTSCGDIDDYLRMAVEAEACGWDGVFVWDDIAVGSTPVFDPWVALGAIAAETERVTLGAMVFSLARRRPWKVAREAMTLDRLSGGRLVLPVGLGGPWDGGYSRVSTDEADRRVRAQKLDECLDILRLAWTGEEFSYHGRHYRADRLQFLPRPVRDEGIPIWPVAAWPYPKSLGRAARCDGLIAADLSATDPEASITPAAVANVANWVAEHREDPSMPFDIVVEGQSSGSDASTDRSIVEPLAQAGATWWMESRWGEQETARSLLDRIRQGPPQW
jgi:alkanesulfonate monooxygenase SsuD/methylene tetrahydromethanopterin reductase-like flavin-dependent oxidoreductase (luciferase family)